MSKQMHHEIEQIVVFTLDDLLYGIPLNTVVRVIHAIEIRHLSNSPEIISGIINVEGRIIPVVDIRKRFSLAAKEIDPDDRLIIADTGKRRIALIVSSVTGIELPGPGQFENATESLPFVRYIKGVAKVENDLILIYDLEKFLSLEEEHDLEKALSKTTR